ncbi:MAG: SCO family protein [Desulfurococcales archaeon]|nr:SCO family protein [Desulfurococcales archaeon]
MNAKTKTILVAALAGLAVSISVGYLLGAGMIGPRLESNRPADVYGTVSVSNWNKPAPVYTINSTAGPVTIPVEGKVNVLLPQYVRCPDICHLESQMMIYVMNRSIQEGWADEVVWVTVEVDPWDGTPEMAVEYQKRVAKDLLDKVNWIWLFDSVEKMQEFYDAYGIYVEKAESGLVNHFGGFLIIDKNGVIRYIVHPDWNKVYDTAQVLYDKVVELVREG